MPFQSEKQRRYLWANEPEIARDWTDRYGAVNGGIMDVASNGNLRHDFQNYTNGGGNVSVPTSFQARPQSDPVNLAYVTPQEQGILQNLKPGTPHQGPMGIPNYDSFDAAGNYTSGATMSGMETGASNERARADRRAAGISPQAAADIRSGAVAAGAGGTRQEERAARQMFPNAFRESRRGTGFRGFGGNIWRGIMSMFGGVPGKIGSFLSRIDPRQLRDGMTQTQWKNARTDRRRNKRMEYLSGRKSKGLGYSKQAYADLLAQGLTDPFQDAIKADYEREGDDLYLQNPSKNYLSSIDLSGYDEVPSNEASPLGLSTDVFTNPDYEEFPRDIPESEYEGMFNGIRSIDNELNTPNDKDFFLG